MKSTIRRTRCRVKSADNQLPCNERCVAHYPFARLGPVDFSTNYRQWGRVSQLTESVRCLCHLTGVYMILIATPSTSQDVNLSDSHARPSSLHSSSSGSSVTYILYTLKFPRHLGQTREYCYICSSMANLNQQPYLLPQQPYLYPSYRNQFSEQPVIQNPSSSESSFRAPAHKHAHHLHSIPPREKSTRTLIIDHMLWVHGRL